MKEIVTTKPEALPPKLGPEAETITQMLRIAKDVRDSGAPLDTPSIKHVVRHFQKELRMFGIGGGTRQQVSSTDEGFVGFAVNAKTKRAIAVHESGEVVWEGKVPDRGTHIDPRTGKILDQRTLFISQYIVPPGCIATIILCGALALSALSGNGTESSNRNNGADVPDLRSTAIVPALTTETIRPVITKTFIPQKSFTPTTTFTGSPPRTETPAILNSPQTEIKTKDCKPIIPGVIYNCK